jgi:predicted phosphodiesterase
MKLHILSDLHLSVSPFEAPATDADLVILAGDLARPEQAMAWARALGKPALYVPGNHEFYGSSPGATLNQLRALSEGSSVRVLSDEAVVIGGVRFLGATLWTDFALYGTGDAVREAQAQGAALLRDFSRIALDPPAESMFQPRHALRLHERSRGWLREQLSERLDGPTVVITHHAPSPRSVHPRFASSPINPCFVSDLEDLMNGEHVPLWIHGHTHDSFDYAVGGTRVVCNPRGYCRGAMRENEAFNPALVLEV